MAEDLGLGWLADAGTSAMGVGGDIAYTLIFLMLFGAGAFALLYVLSFRHKVLVRIMTNKGSKYPFWDSAKELKVDGVHFWKLKKRKDVVPVPPRESLYPLGKDLLGKPKFYAECYWSQETGYVWAEDTVDQKDFSCKVETLEVMPGGMEKKVIKETFQPFTTQERALHVSGLTKAHMRKKKNLMDTVTQLAVPVMFITLIICILVFWEDVAKPAQDMAVLNERLMKDNAEISAQNARMLSVLAGKLEAGDITVSQKIPSDAGGG